MNKNLKLLLIASLIIILTFSLVIAARNSNSNPNRERGHNNTNFSSNNTSNHGLCVREQSWKRQDCFLQAKNNSIQCRLNVLNEIKNTTTNNQTVNKTEVKNMLKECKNQYKQEKTQCKQEFKNNKLLCEQYRSCLDIYKPVCGSVEIQCITTPCDPIQQTFSNMCELRKNPRATFLHKGGCINNNSSNQS